MSKLKNCGMKCLYWLIGLTIIIAWVMMMAVGYMMLYPFKPIEFNDEQFPVLTEDVRGGDELIFVVDSCKYMEIPAEVQVSYVDGVIYDTPTVLTSKSTGCGVANVTQVIPNQLIAGEYKLRVIFNYDVNHFRTISYTKYTETFNIIE